MENEVKEYTVTIYTENQIGLLSQITNVFTRHGLSIWSLSAGPSSMEGIHNITIVTSGIEKKVKESVQQIEKRVDVIKVFYYTRDKIVYREVALYKVPTPCLLEGDIESILGRYHARIVEMNSVHSVAENRHFRRNRAPVRRAEALRHPAVCPLRTHRHLPGRAGTCLQVPPETGKRKE